MYTITVYIYNVKGILFPTKHEVNYRSEDYLTDNDTLPYNHTSIIDD